MHRRASSSVLIPGKTHSAVAEELRHRFAGSALINASSRCPRQRLEEETFRVIAPNRKHAHIASSAAENPAGSVSTGTSRNFRKRTRRRGACNVTDPKKKRVRIASLRQFGAAWMDRWSS